MIYGYIRWSSEKQTDGTSLERQQELIDAYGKATKQKPDRIFRDEGVSAAKGRHRSEGQLGELLKIAKANDQIWVENMDRLSREEATISVPEFMAILKRGITIVITVNHRKITKDSNMDMLPEVFESFRSASETARKRQLVADAWAIIHEKAKKGIPHPSRLPGWIENCGGKFGFNKHADTMKTIIELFLQGKGTVSITRHLNENKVRTMGTTDAWCVGTVKHLLKSRALIGEYAAGGKEIIKDYYPKLIDDATYYKILSICNSRKVNSVGRGANTVSSIFTGLLVDPEDNKLTVCRNGKYHYILNGAYLYRREDGHKVFSYRAFEKAFLLWVKEVQFQSKEKVDNIGVITARLELVNKKISAMQTAIDNDTTGTIDALITSLTKLSAEKAELIKALEAEKVTSSTIGDPNELMSITDREELRTKVGQLIEKITVYIAAKDDEVKRLCLAVVYFRNGQYKHFAVRTLYGHKGEATGVEGLETLTADDKKQLGQVKRLQSYAEALLNADWTTTKYHEFKFEP